MPDIKCASFNAFVAWITRRGLWPLMAISMLLIVALLSQPGKLQQLNRLIQDFSISLQDETLQDDIVIVTIDNKSVTALGRWPWRRTLHAELLDRISEDQPRAIGLDILFTEPETTYLHDDEMLAAAIKRSSPVVLPVFVQPVGGTRQVIAPLDSIAKHAGLGKVHVKVDNDGIVRSVYLQEEVNGRTWDQFSLALLNAGGDHRAPASLLKGAAASTDHEIHKYPMLVPYAGGAGHFSYVSYIDVIRGDVPPGFFKAKYVLVGATASGIGDQYATPTAGQSHLMPGVEIQANVAHALLHNVKLQPASPVRNTMFNLLFMGLALIGFALLSPFFALLLTISLALTLFVITCFSTSFFGILFAPAAGILGLIFIYPLWSWQRLNTAAHFLSVELESLQQAEYAPFTARQSPLIRDFLDRRIAALESATRQLQNLHRFVTSSVDNLPHPTLISGIDGLVRIANQSAARHFDVDNADVLLGQSLLELVADVASNDRDTSLLLHALAQQDVSAVEGEAKDGRGRDLIIKCVPIMNTDNIHTGWILSLVDVSKLHQAERDREEAFRFITHDIRAPLSSIITLLELRHLQSAETHDDLMRRLERYANNALALADNFISLSRAKSGEYQFEHLDLNNILTEVVDDAWAASQARNLRISMINTTEPAHVLADRSLLERALTNLISNAIKFSPNDSQIICTITRHDQYWDIAIADRGPGLAPEQQAALFQPFNRLHAQSHPEIEGTGLGLVFVNEVARRHGGRVAVESEPGQGSTFHLLIPSAALPIMKEPHLKPAASAFL